MPNHRGCKIDDRGAAVVHQHDTDKHGESPVSAWTEVAQHRPLDAGNVQPEHAVGQIEEGGGNVEDAAFCSAVGDVAVGEDGGGARCKVANPAGLYVHTRMGVGFGSMGFQFCEDTVNRRQWWPANVGLCAAAHQCAA
eukprot:2191728-Prymnesium_polylepis.1